MNPHNFMAEHGAALVERGFPILPIQPRTKCPGVYRNGRWRNYPQWTRHCNRPTTEHEIEVWGDWPQAGIGVAAGRFIGIDIDVLEPPGLAVVIEGLAKRYLGETPAVRIGKEPKRLLVYRATTPFAGFKYPPIEVLGLGQQFIAYGIHPDTHQPYRWPVATLRDLDPADLPAISEEQARTFAMAAYALLDPHHKPQTLIAGQSAQPVAAGGTDDMPGAPALRGTTEAVSDAMRWISNADLDYDSWVRIGLALKGALGAEGWPLFDAWSATSSKYDEAFTRGRWESFAPKRIGAGTIYRLALARGWQPPPGVQLNGALGVHGQHPARKLLDALPAAGAGKRSQAAASGGQTAASGGQTAASGGQSAASGGAAAAPGCDRIADGLSVAQPPDGARPAGRTPLAMPAGWSAVEGVLKALMDFMALTAKRPQPVLALGASLCAVGALMGRKYRTEANVRSNLYVVGIAESGAGKNHSRVVINELFHRAGLLHYLGGNKIASGSGLLTALMRQPSILFQLDEFGMFLAAAADRKRSPRYICEILDLMTELYTTAGTTYFGVEYASTQHNDAHRAIHQPCACIYGTTTPLHFWQALQASNVADGSLARFLILESEEDFPDSNEAFGLVDPPHDLIEQLILLHKGGGKLNGNLSDVGGVEAVRVEPRVVPMTPQARCAFRALDLALIGELRTSRGTGFSSILARVEENATKLALIRAVSRDPVDPRIEETDAAWGALLARHCAELTIREVVARVSENLVEQQHKRSLKILRDAGAAGLSKSDFTRRTQFLDHRQRDGVLRTLSEAGLIAMEVAHTGGRPSVTIRLTDA